MEQTKPKKWNVDPKAIADPGYTKWLGDHSGAENQMRQRTANFELYGLIAKNKSIHEFSPGRSGSGKYFSEGSSQYILRKSLANTIQRVPDGELNTQYDKASAEHILMEYIFNNKVLWSEFEGIDMLANLTNSFKMAFIYGFAPVRTGFERDADNDVRISFTIENWPDIAINQDCKDLRRPQILWHRSFLSKAEVEALINEEGNVGDPTYHADTIKYVIDNQTFGGKPWESEKLGDKMKGGTSVDSLELLTKYERGSDKFVTYVPALKAKFRTVRNEDPRKGIPWSFMILETDPDFPLGLSQIEFLLADQQFQDLFQTSAYKNLLLAMEPPIMVAGWETNPASYRFEPRKIWNLGNNPNQVKVEPVEISNQVLSSFLTTREGIAAGMLRQLNVMDGTLSNDAGVPGFSATPQGVEAQTKTKEISINQYQKRVEYFFVDFAIQALRMYVNAMKGRKWLTVDENTRRKLYDIDREDLIDGNKVEVDFDVLSTDILEFKVRTGSLVEKKEDQEREALSATIQPFVQNLMGWSEENKAVIENQVLLPAAARLLELSDTDVGQKLAGALSSQMAKVMMDQMQGQIDEQGAQIEEQEYELDEMRMDQDQAPPAQEQMPVATPGGAPAAPGIPDLGMGGASPSSPPMSDQDIYDLQPETAGQQMGRPTDLLDL